MLNKVFLIGNLGADPDTKFTQSGTAVVNFNMATSKRFKNKEGRVEEKTEWHRIVAWGKLAEICDKYLSKGSKIHVEGEIQTRKWTNQDGKDQYTTEIVIHDMKMLSPSQKQSDNGTYSQEPPPGYDTGDVPF